MSQRSAASSSMPMSCEREQTRRRCYLCETLHTSEASRAVSMFVSENITKMQIETICEMVRQTIKEEDGESLSYEDVHTHITKHYSDKKIDACIMLQDLKKLAHSASTLSYSNDEETGARMLDQKSCQVYLDAVKQIVAVHRTLNS